MKKEMIKWLIVWGFIAIGLLIYFELAHPIYIYTVDDWLNIVNERHAYPYTGTLNPGKILPETIFPFIAEVARWTVYPITHDFIGSITIVEGIILAGVALLYFYEIISCVDEEKTANKNLCLGVFLVLSHFYLYKNSRNTFSNSNLTDVIHYTIPYLVNSIAVCIFMKKKTGSRITPLEVLLIYLAIFSNMFQSIILVTYMFFRMVRNIAMDKDRKITYICKQNLISLLTLVMWAIELYVEKNGTRAEQLDELKHEFGFIDSIKGYILSFFAIRDEIIWGTIILLVIGVITFCKKERTNRKEFLKNILFENQIGVLIASFIATSIYIILLDAYISQDVYLLRTDVYNTVLFYPILVFVMILNYVMKNNRMICGILPILIFCMMFQTAFHSSIYGPSLNGNEKKVFQDDVIRQVKEADQNNETKVEIETTRYWVDITSEPWLESAMSRALFTYGITSENIEIDFIVRDEIH